jgi:predicted ATPase
MADGGLLLQIKDRAVRAPGTRTLCIRRDLKMLAYLVLLHDPMPPPFIGIEEPENFQHPRLLPELAEECRAAAPELRSWQPRIRPSRGCAAAGGGPGLVA